MGKPTSKCSTCGLPRNRPGACDACMLADHRDIRGRRGPTRRMLSAQAVEAMNRLRAKRVQRP